MNILFICSRNKWRSATAETIYKDHPVHRVRSAGTAASAVVRVTAKHIAWADIIFAMEKKHQQRLREEFPGEMDGKQLVVLDIPDDYTYMDPELIDIIRQSVGQWMEE